MSYVLIVQSAGRESDEIFGVDPVTEVHGPFERDEAVEVSKRIDAMWRAAAEEFGARAFPYGEMTVTVALLLGSDPTSHERYRDPEVIASNWTYDPELHG